jgi:hypothetical protein
MTPRASLLVLTPLLALSLGAATCAGVDEAGLGSGAAGSGAAGSGAAGSPFGTPITGTAGRAPSGAAGAAGAAAAPHACVNLECRQTSCTLGNCAAPRCAAQQKPETTLSGTIYDPAGRLPLYNVALYVPNAPLDPIVDGVTCDRCAGKSSGQPIASTITDATGHFVLKNPPIGKDVPLVIQVGKWRREVKVPEIAPCQDNVLTDKDLSRLPRSQAEGHIPRIAVTTGHADALECLLRKVGIADAEFTTEKGNGRVHLFVGGQGEDGQGANSLVSGEALPGAATLWGDPARLMKYDMLVLSCEGSTFGKAKMPYLGNIKSYADRGGRIFDDHLHFYWLQKGPAPWPDTADWLGDEGDLNSVTAKIDTTFPKGVAFSDWLVNVAATPTRGQIAIEMAQHSVADHHKPTSQRWIYLDDPKAVQYLTFNTPVEVPEAQQCGRVVFTDIHVSSVGGASDVSHPETPFPSGCTTNTLSPQEKALEFMLFDLSSCVQEDVKPPAPPPIIE